MPQAEGGFANSADFIDTVLAVAAQGRIIHESALRLIFVLRRAGKKGYAWWKRTRLAACPLPCRPENRHEEALHVPGRHVEGTMSQGRLHQVTWN